MKRRDFLGWIVGALVVSITRPLRWLHLVPPTNLTFLAGAHQTIIPSAKSPTGYFCTRWGCVQAPGWDRYAMQPSDGVIGAPCTRQGAICGAGLEIPGPAVRQVLGEQPYWTRMELGTVDLAVIGQPNRGQMRVLGNWLGAMAMSNIIPVRHS